MSEDELHLHAGPIKLRLNMNVPGEIIEVDIGDPLAWKRDHPEAYRQVLEETDARLAELTDGWGLHPPTPTGDEPVVIDLPADDSRKSPKRLPPSKDRLTMTVEEAATALGISRAFAYEAVNNGEIPTIRIGRRILVPKAALNRLLSGVPSPTDGGNRPAQG